MPSPLSPDYIDNPYSERDYYRAAPFRVTFPVPEVRTQLMVRVCPADAAW